MAYVIKAGVVRVGAEVAIVLGSDLISLVSLGVLRESSDEVGEGFVQRRQGLVVGELGVWGESGGRGKCKVGVCGRGRDTAR